MRNQQSYTGFNTHDGQVDGGPGAKKRPRKAAARARTGAAFWNDEYSNQNNTSPQSTTHLALSTEPSEDLAKFTRYLERDSGRYYLNPLATATDLGCGNGRNLIFLAETFGMKGVGFDISEEAVNIAKKNSKEFPITYTASSIAFNSENSIPLPDNSQTLVLDMMTSHFLDKQERADLRAEIARILKPGGWLFFKTFLLDEDTHAERLLKEFPAEESGSYIHPQIGVAEHVFTEQEIIEMFEAQIEVTTKAKNKKSKGKVTTTPSPFVIQKILKSHRHHSRRGTHGKVIQGKRRSISVYIQKN